MLKDHELTNSWAVKPSEFNVNKTVFNGDPGSADESSNVAVSQGAGPTGFVPPLYSKSRSNLIESAYEIPAEPKIKTPNKNANRFLFIAPP